LTAFPEIEAHPVIRWALMPVHWLNRIKNSCYCDLFSGGFQIFSGGSTVTVPGWITMRLGVGKVVVEDLFGLCDQRVDFQVPDRVLTIFRSSSACWYR
jgi:hypothetical protein